MVAASASVATIGLEDVRRRFLAFVVEQYPFAFAAAERAVDAAFAEESASPDDERGIGRRVAGALRRELTPPQRPLPETTPFVTAEERFATEVDRFCDDVRSFFEREAIRASITDDERRAMLEGIILTRAVDNRMKQLFLTGEMKYGELGFQGKGFRSLGQEAIWAAALRLKRGAGHVVAGAWKGDVVAPLIRDLGLMLAFTDGDVELALNAQVGKAGAPLDGKDLHLGALDRGVLPAAAPLSIATCTVVGHTLAFSLRGEPRVGFSFIGDGGSSLGEWHEAINLAAARRLPCVFCVQNNQTALSTPVDQQSATRVFAEKARGYGIPGATIDGTDPESIAAGFSWAAERARRGEGPALIELVAMRMCGHAHHDDMLYLGGDPAMSFELPDVPTAGYVDKDRYARWAPRDPLASYARLLVDRGVVSASEVESMKTDARERCDRAAAALVERQWPDGRGAGAGVLSDGSVVEHGQPVAVPPLSAGALPAVVVDPAPAFTPKGRTLLDAVALGIGDVLAANPEAFVFGEDVGAPYGNAFLLLKPLCDDYADRLINAPIAEGAIIGGLVGAALEGMCPLGEMQFNDFVASGFNQLVNNAAKFRYRTGRNLPFVLRMPWGGLRRAGPYHSQDTSPWFARTFGLKIVAPSTPHDARALFVAAAREKDPVLFYEHIALYRDPKIKQLLDEAPGDIAIGEAAFRRTGEDLSIISYGAYVHRAMKAAAALEAEDDVTCDVLDLRTLHPIDFARIEATVRKTGRVLLVGEDSKSGSILESIASKIGEAMFEQLDGPVRVLGALDTPVPYAPSLEDAFLISDEHLLETARAMLRW